MRPPRITRRRVIYATCFTLILIVAGNSIARSCGREGHDLRIVSVDEAKAAVRRYADETIALIPNATIGSPKGEPDWQPCDGQSGSTYNALSITQIIVPPDKALEILHLLRNHWEQLGYHITKNRAWSHRRSGDLAATNPKDSYSITLTAGDSDQVFSLIAASPCYRSPTPLE